MPDYHLAYVPTARQLVFHNCTADEALYGGAAGGGKSAATVVDALLHCINIDGFQAYLFRRSYPELEQSLITEAFKHIPEGVGQYNGTAHEWRFPNKSVMRFRHCNSEQDKYNYQGVEMHALYIDELTHFTKNVYDFLISRVRAPKSMNIKAFVRCTSNPGGVGHAWVKSTFVDPMPNGGKIVKPIFIESLNKVIKRTYEFIPAKLRDNPHLGLDYEVGLESLPKAMRDAYLMGDWSQFSGQVFIEWREDPFNYDSGLNTHVINAFEIPDSWPRYMGFDHGYTKPFSVQWFAVDPDNRMYLYREWYGCENPKDAPNVGMMLHPKQIAEGILDREQAERSRGIHIRRVGDPAIWGSQTGESVGEMMQLAGVYIEGGDNNRLAGKMQTHFRLAFDDTNRPGLYVFRECKNFIRTIPYLVYSETRVEDVNTNGEDHSYDSARYIFMERPVSAKVQQKILEKPFNPLI